MIFQKYCCSLPPVLILPQFPINSLLPNSLPLTLTNLVDPQNATTLMPALPLCVDPAPNLSPSLNLDADSSAIAQAIPVSSTLLQEIVEQSPMEEAGTTFPPLVP